VGRWVGGWLCVCERERERERERARAKKRERVEWLSEHVHNSKGL